MFKFIKYLIETLKASPLASLCMLYVVTITLIIINNLFRYGLHQAINEILGFSIYTCVGGMVICGVIIIKKWKN